MRCLFSMPPLLLATPPTPPEVAADPTSRKHSLHTTICPQRPRSYSLGRRPQDPPPAPTRSSTAVQILHDRRSCRLSTAGPDQIGRPRHPQTLPPPDPRRGEGDAKLREAEVASAWSGAELREAEAASAWSGCRESVTTAYGLKTEMSHTTEITVKVEETVTN